MILPISRALIKLCVAPFLFLSIPRCVLAEETWVEVGYVVASVEGTGFGKDVALDGMTMVVCDWAYETNNDGRAYVFSWNGIAFEEDTVLVPDLQAASDTSFDGWAVAVDDETIVIAASGSNAAFVYVKDAGGVWSLQQELTPSDAGGSFGIAVAVHGDRIVVGANTARNIVGAAYVFERSGTSWNETKILRPNDNAGYQFGQDVDLEEDMIVIGAPGHTKSRGAVYVFALNDAHVWKETKIIVASDYTDGASFGYSVALSGSSIAVGSLSSGSAESNGRAYIYTGPDFDETALLQGDASGNDQFGHSVALFGDTAVVGASYHDSKNGATYIFQRPRKDYSWSQTAKLTSSVGNGEQLGYSVAISGDFVVTGASHSRFGDVYVFEEDVDTQTCVFRVECK
jgi:hypothetical protein